MNFIGVGYKIYFVFDDFVCFVFRVCIIIGGCFVLFGSVIILKVVYMLVIDNELKRVRNDVF